MPNESLKTKPEKLPKTKTELEALVLAELRAASQCGGAVRVTVVAYDDYRVGATRWPVAIRAHPRRKNANARSATSSAASSSILISRCEREAGSANHPRVRIQRTGSFGYSIARRSAETATR